MRPDPSQFAHWYPVDVRFKDIDVGGHSHHSNALVYFEEARAAYLAEFMGRRELDEIDFILAEARIRYHARVLYPLRMKVGVRVPTIGKKHFVLEYLALDEDGTDLLSGQTTLVMYDYEAGKSMAIPPDMRATLGPTGGGK